MWLCRELWWVCGWWAAVMCRRPDADWPHQPLPPVVMLSFIATTQPSSRWCTSRSKSNNHGASFKEWGQYGLCVNQSDQDCRQINTELYLILNNSIMVPKWSGRVPSCPPAACLPCWTALKPPWAPTQLANSAVSRASGPVLLFLINLKNNRQAFGKR